MTRRSPYETNYQLLCRMLVEERTKAGLTQIELAKLLGRGQSYVSRYESGQRRLYYFDVLEIANAVGFDVGAFTKKLASKSKFVKRS